MSTTPPGDEPATVPVREVTAVQVGAVGLHVEHMYGTRKPTLWWIFWSRRFVTVPVNVFVVEHDDGLILFDTGPSQSLVTDPGYWPDRVTRLFMRKIFRLHIGPEDTLAIQLERAGYRTADVRTAVLSHLHFDHAGGIGDLPDAELLVAPEAWEHLLGPHAVREAVLRRDLDVPGARWRQMEFVPTDDPDLAPFTEVHDVTGDGSVLVVPTPGHLPGSVSMLVRRAAAPPVLLIGDLTYSEDLLQRDQVPATGDAAVLRESFAKVRALKAHTPDLVVVASHDTTGAVKLAARPDPSGPRAVRTTTS